MVQLSVAVLCFIFSATIFAATAPITGPRYPKRDLSTPRLYFGYGSNLSKQQMLSRCPSSDWYNHTSSDGITYGPLAFLPNYYWVIDPRGYANVQPIQTQEDIECNNCFSGVYGLMYQLDIGGGTRDEDSLDKDEGVPTSYEKFELDVILVDPKSREVIAGEVMKALVYIDPRNGTGTISDTYTTRINIGINDGVVNGMPQSWVDVIRKFVPAG